MQCIADAILTKHLIAGGSENVHASLPTAD